MEFKKYIDYRLLGITGAVLLIISEFLPWFSGLNLFDIYVLATIVNLEDSFLALTGKKVK